MIKLFSARFDMSNSIQSDLNQWVVEGVVTDASGTYSEMDVTAGDVIYNDLSQIGSGYARYKIITVDPETTFGYLKVVVQWDITEDSSIDPCPGLPAIIGQADTNGVTAVSNITINGVDESFITAVRNIEAMRMSEKIAIASNLASISSASKEPKLGVPVKDGAFLTSKSNGTRIWSYIDPVTKGMMGIANGVASLDGTGKIPAGQLPAIAITDTYIVSSDSEMLSLDAHIGDIAIRQDTSKTYILKSSPATNIGNWVPLAATTDNPIKPPFSATDIIEENDRNFVTDIEKQSLSGVGQNIQTSLYTMENSITNMQQTLIDNKAASDKAMSDYETATNKQITDFETATNSSMTTINSSITTINNNLANKMEFHGIVDTNTALQALSNPKTGWLVSVSADEKNYGNQTMYSFDGTQWKKLTGINWIAQNIAPANTTLLWLDTSQTTPVLNWYNGLSWVPISGGSGGSSSLAINDSVPSASTVYSSQKTMLEIAKKANVAHTHTPTDLVLDSDHNFMTGAEKTVVDNLSDNNGVLNYKGAAIAIDSSTILQDNVSASTTTFSSNKISTLISSLQPVLGFTPENAANRGVPGGYAELTTGGTIPITRIPTTARQQVYVVLNAINMGKLSGMLPGDLSYQTSTGNFYVYDGTQWNLLTSADPQAGVILNNYIATVNPAFTDDTTEGYSVGSLWVNSLTKKCYICTDNTQGAANWEMMAGTTTLSIGNIETFLYETNDPNRTVSQTDFTIPTIDPNNDFIQVFVDGVEKTKDEHYTIKDATTISFVDPIDPTSEVSGEIIQSDLNATEHNMKKSDYDSNNDGKVNSADIADVAKSIRTWQPNTSYKAGDLLLTNNQLVTVVADFKSGISFDPSTVTNVYAKLKDLSDFTTSNLTEGTDKLYITANQKSQIVNIPTALGSIDLLNTWSLSQKALTPADATSSNKLVSTQTLNSAITSSLKFTNLSDAPKTLIPSSLVTTKADGTGLTLMQNPHFPIQGIIDNSKTEYADVTKIQFNDLSTASFTNGVLSLDLKSYSTKLVDMPQDYEHGNLLVCNKDTMRYELHSIGDLTISKENYEQDLSLASWLYDSGLGQYYSIITHNLGSTHLIVGFLDVNNYSRNDIRYQVMDSNNIKILASSPIVLKVSINCSLGVVNGYWDKTFDLSQLTTVDDTRTRTDKSWSSQYTYNLLANYSLRAQTYSKDECTALFASKANDHTHANMSVINGFTTDTNGKLAWGGQTIITKIQPYYYSKQWRGENHPELEVVFDTSSIYSSLNYTAIVSSEILIRNAQQSVDPATDLANQLELVITDGDMTLIDITLAPQEVQKYSLGISPNVKVMVKGDFDGNIYISAF